MSSNILKESYELETKYGPFFTGGSIEWSSDGDYFLCQNGGSVNILSVATGRVQGILGENVEDREEDTINSFALNPCNEEAVTHHKSGLFKLWNWKEVKLKKLWKGIHNGPVARIAFFSGSANSMASGGSDGGVRLWNLDHHACTHSLKGIQGVVSVLASHPVKEKNLLFAAADDTKILGWNIKTGKEVLKLSGHFSKITSIDFHDDGEHLISSGRDKVIILWKISANGSIVRTVPVYEGIEGIFLLPLNNAEKLIEGYQSNGIYVAAGGEKGCVKVWEMRTGNKVYEQSNSILSESKDDGGLSVTQLLFNKVSNSLTIVSVEHNIIVHDLDSFECKKQLVGYSDEILDVVYLGEEDDHLAIATNSPDIKIYRLETMNCQLLRGHTDIVLALAVTKADKSFLLSSGKDNSVRVWRMDSKTCKVSCIAKATRHTGSVGSISISETSLTFFLSVSQDYCLKIWDIGDDLKIKDNIENNASDQSITVRYTELAHHKDINAVAISPNDKLVATGSQDKTAKIWTAENLKLVGVLRGHKRGVWSVKFSPIDQVILTTSADCNLKLWSLNDLSCLKTLEGHESSVLKAEFLTRGMQLITAGADGLLKLWNVKSSECVATFEHHEDRIWALAVSRKEDRIISGGSDSVLAIWRDVTDDKKLLAKEEMERLIIDEEKLANLLKADKLLSALKFALRLERPLQVLKIIESVIKKGEKGLKETINKLKDSQKESLLRCAVNWNTNSRNCQSAQLVINVLLDEISRGDFKTTLADGGFLSSQLESMLPYTERHFKRLTQLIQDLNIISYTVNCMQPHNKIMQTSTSTTIDIATNTRII